MQSRLSHRTNSWTAFTFKWTTQQSCQWQSCCVVHLNVTYLLKMGATEKKFDENKHRNLELINHQSDDDLSQTPFWKAECLDRIITARVLHSKGFSEWMLQKTVSSNLQQVRTPGNRSICFPPFKSVAPVSHGNQFPTA